MTSKSEQAFGYGRGPRRADASMTARRQDT
jgi:hypothetical protein